MKSNLYTLLLLLLFSLIGRAQIAPPAICNPCRNKKTVFGQNGSSASITYENYGAVTVNSTISHLPAKVIKVTAEIVDMQRMGETGCLMCTRDSREFGNFVSGTLNSNPGNLLNGGSGYSKQIQWQYNVPTLVNNFSYGLQMMFPPINAVACCKDSLRICTRWSFTDSNCITCDTLICNVVTRSYKKPIWGGAISADGLIGKMGVPFSSWYALSDDKVPDDFTKQIQAFYDKNSEMTGKMSARYDSVMHSVYQSVRMMKVQGVTDGLWTAINEKLVSNNFQLNNSCLGGDFEDSMLYLAQWSGGYGVCFPWNTIPTVATYASGITPNVGLGGGSGCSSVFADMAGQATETHQAIVPYGNDPTIGSLLKTTCDPGNRHSLRLGNSCPGAGTEYLSKTFIVPPGTGVIKFMYALVMNGNHLPAQTGFSTSFNVNVYDAIGNPIIGAVFLDDGNPIAFDRVVSDPSNSFFQKTTYILNGQTLPIFYRDWTCAKIDLRGYGGQQVTVAFTTTDCSGDGYGGHMAYAYIDNWCGDCRCAKLGSLNIKPIGDSCIKDGTKICVDYDIPTIGSTTGTGTITLNFYKGGSLVSPLYTLSTTVAGPSGTYCFSIDPAKLPCSPGTTGYDIEAKGTYSITVGGVTTTEVFTCPDPFGNHQGIKQGLNNDLICCNTKADDCCYWFRKKVTTQVSILGNSIKFVPTFVAGPALIKQVRISVVNFERTSSSNECLSCEPNAGRYGVMSVPQNYAGGGKDPIEGMNYPTKPLVMGCFPVPCPQWNTYPSSEVTWGGINGPGYNLMDGIGDQSTTFTVFFPARSKLSCCDDTLKVCIKYSFTDVECRTCDTIICYKIVKGQPAPTPISTGSLNKAANGLDEENPGTDMGMVDNKAVLRRKN